MALQLPPPALIRNDEATAQLVYDELTKLIAGHPNATTTYLFYEELDAWLGPWGPSGYPLGYGKKYNILFSQNARLQADPSARAWVRRTGILLQEALRDFLVDLVRNGTNANGVSIQGLTEAQLRAAAFESHPRAYTEAGLTMVALAAPELTLEIATIPGAEFNPFTSDTFFSTIDQVIETAGIVAPQAVATGLAAIMPAHSGFLRNAARADRMRMRHETGQIRSLAALRDGLTRGDYDHPPWLDEIIHRLELTEFHDAGTRRFAADVIRIAAQRKQMVRQRAEDFVGDNADLRARLPQSSSTLRRGR